VLCGISSVTLRFLPTVFIVADARKQSALKETIMKTSEKKAQSCVTDHNFLCGVLKKYFRHAVVAAVALVLLSAAARAGNGPVGNEGVDDRGAVRLLGTIPVPVHAGNNTAGALYSFDISFVDQSTQTYYVADRSNNVVDVVDAKTDTFLKQISGGFAGLTASTATSGPNGVVAAGRWLFVTDAPSRVVTIDLTTDTVVSAVTTKANEPTRADELAYDPEDGLLLVINNAATPPFGTLISVNKANGHLTLGPQIIFDAAHGVDAQNGAEQPVWDPGTGKFYLSIPQIGATVSHGGVIRISTTGTVEATYPVEFCSPAGLALGPRENLLVGCNTVFDTGGNVWSPTGAVTAAPQDVILNAQTGNIIKHVLGAGAGDEVWYNSGDGNYYATGSGSPLRPLPAATASGSTPFAVIDAEDQNLIQLVPAFNVAAVTTGPAASQHPAGTSHSVAANADNNHVFVPLGANNVFPGCLTGCIAVYSRPEKQE
jgi:hypothetical protein